jgi:uncharacterized membrane protein
MKLSTRITIAVLLVAGSSGVVYAYNRHGDWGMTSAEKIEFVGDRVSKELGLSDEQRQKFTSLAETFTAAMQEIRPSRDERIGEIAQLLQEPGFDQARALELVQQRTRTIDARAPEVIASLAGFVDSLSEDQRRQLLEFVQHRHGHHRHDEHHRQTD